MLIKSPILGEFYTARSRLLNCQQAINLYVETVDTKDGKEPGMLITCPGLDWLNTIGTGPWRALRVVANGLFGVSGNTFYQITGLYAGRPLGFMTTNRGPVQMVDNGHHILLVEGSTPYGFDIEANFFGPLTMPFQSTFPNSAPLTCAYQDGYFLVNETGTQKWWQSALNNVFVWEPLNFASKEAQPDTLVVIVDNHREVWLLGSQTTEVWINGGSQGVGLDFVFQRLQGVFIQEGCVAPYSAVVAGPSVIWLSSSREGQGVVLQAHGYQAVRISTHAIEREIQSYPRIDDAIAYSYQQEGHLFYMLTFPSANVTWCFDHSTGLWHQRAGWDNGEYTRHRSNCYASFQGKCIVGDFETGDLYAFNLDAYDDAGRKRKWLRSFPAFPTGQITLKTVFMNQLQVYMEGGIGRKSPTAIREVSQADPIAAIPVRLTEVGPGTFPPDGVEIPPNTQLYVTLIGGGGGGYNGLNDEASGCGGGAGEYLERALVTYDGTPIPFNVGAGGLAADFGSIGTTAGDGGVTSFGTLNGLGGRGGGPTSNPPDANYGHGARNTFGGVGSPNALLSPGDYSGANGGCAGYDATPATAGGLSIVACQSVPNPLSAPVLGGPAGISTNGVDTLAGPGGGGASSPFGKGGKGGNTNVDFNTAESGTPPGLLAYGAGGGGGGSTADVATVGGNGRQGVIIVEWYI